MYCRTTKLHASSSKSERGPEGFHLVLILLRPYGAVYQQLRMRLQMAFAALTVTFKTRHTHSRQEIQQGYKPLLETSRQSKDVSELTNSVVQSYRWSH